MHLLPTVGMVEVQVMLVYLLEWRAGQELKTNRRRREGRARMMKRLDVRRVVRTDFFEGLHFVGVSGWLFNR